MEGRGIHKVLTAAGLVLIVVLIFYMMRLNERLDRQEGRAAYASEASQCSASCEANYATARRRCSAYSYDGTRDWCRAQARTVRSSCMSRCPS
jgi:hypothetical protein